MPLAALPKAINRLQVSEAPGGGERKFTPMDIDPASRPVSSGGVGGEGEALNSSGKVVVGGESGESEEGVCRPGEDCEDCA